MPQMICECFLVENKDARGGSLLGVSCLLFFLSNQSFQNQIAVLNICDLIVAISWEEEPVANHPPVSNVSDDSLQDNGGEGNSNTLTV